MLDILARSLAVGPSQGRSLAFSAAVFRELCDDAFCLRISLAYTLGTNLKAQRTLGKAAEKRSGETSDYTSKI